MLEIMTSIFLSVATMFLFWVGIALEKRLEAQRDLFHAEARKANTDARISELYLHKQGRPTQPIRAGLPASMNPLSPTGPSFPRI